MNYASTKTQTTCTELSAYIAVNQHQHHQVLKIEKKLIRKMFKSHLSFTNYGN